MKRAPSGPSLLALVALAAGCLKSPPFRCETSSQCGATARCEPSGYCSVADTTCPGGFRWGADAPDHGQCVSAGATADAPMARPVNECLVQARRTPADSACVADVCAHLERCCTREWSDQCVHLAETRCQKPCGSVVATIGNGRIRVLTWDGATLAPLWSKHTVDNPDGFAALAWGDVDGDLDPDLVTCESSITTGAGTPGKLCIWQNGGSCGEPFCAQKCVDIGDCQHVDWIDADRDGDLDVVASGAYISYLWTNDNGLFGGQVDGQPLGQELIVDTDWADLDGDGVLDAAVCKYDLPDQVARVEVGGAEGLTLTTWWNDQESLRHRRLAFADVDDDGLLDLVVAGDSAVGVEVWRNTEATRFTPSTTRYFQVLGFDAWGLGVADLDGDGDVDLAAATDGGAVLVFRNDHAPPTSASSFTKTPVWQSTTSHGGARLAIGDVDGDHRLDLVVGARPAAPAVGSAIYLARAAGKLGDPSDKPNWIDPDGLIVTDVALTGAW